MDMKKDLKLLEEYIHDYLVKKNMRSTADNFAQEAHIQPSTIPLGGSEEHGYLADMWSLLWDEYTPLLLGDISTSESSSDDEAVAQSAPAEWLTKAILKDLPTATLTELASKTELQVVRDVAAQMLRDQQPPAAGTSSQKPDMGST